MQAVVAAIVGALLFVAGASVASILPAPGVPDVPDASVAPQGAPAWTGYASAFGVVVNGVILAFVAVTMRSVAENLRGGKQ